MLEPDNAGAVIRYFRRHAQLWLILGCLAAFSTANWATVDYTPSDPRFALLTSQALLQNHTVRLDRYVAQDISPTTHQILRKNGHLYYFYPIGTSVVSIPFVWLANLQGRDLSNPETDRNLQKLIASLCLAATFLLMFLIGTGFLNEAYSLLIASTFTFGSSIASTMGSALWSFNFEVVFLLTSLLVVIRSTRWSGWFQPIGLGTLLALAYFCRPTAALGVAAILVILAARQRVATIKTAVVLVAWLAFAMFLSWREFGTLLPSYVSYHADGVVGAGEFLAPLYGTLLGPGRGLLVYCPFLILTVIAAAFNARRLGSNLVFLSMVAWAVALAITIAKFKLWWGGWCFGSRLFTDGLVPLFVLTCLQMSVFVSSSKPVHTRVMTLLFAGLGLVGVFINTFQGLYNESSYTWNGSPDINQNIHYLYDWKYPQFMASPDLLARRHLERTRRLQAQAQLELPTARASAMADPTQENLTQFVVMASQAGDDCAAVTGSARLRAKWGVSAPNVDFAKVLGGCAVRRTELKGPDLFVNGDFAQNLAGWVTHPASDATVSVETDPVGEHVWHVAFRGGNWAVISQRVMLRADTVYLFEATVKSTAPLVALYWQAETGRFLEEVNGYSDWRHLTYAFMTPHWDGQPYLTDFHPVLIKGAGDTWLKGLRLSELSDDLDPASLKR